MLSYIIFLYEIQDIHRNNFAFSPLLDIFIQFLTVASENIGTSFIVIHLVLLLTTQDMYWNDRCPENLHT